MGFLSWIKGRASPGASTRVETHSTSVELGAERDSVVRDGVEVSDPAARRAVIDEVDELAHRFLTLGADATGPAGRLMTMSSTSVVVDGRPVSPDDPRAREKILEVVDKLRAQGLDDLAEDIARQLDEAVRVSPGVSRPLDASRPAVASVPEAPVVSADGAPSETGPGSLESRPISPDAPEPPIPPKPPTPPEPPESL